MLTVYVSDDQLEIDGSKPMGFDFISDHPLRLNAKLPDILVIDFDHVAFDDRKAALELAERAAIHGSVVGFHTFHGMHPMLNNIIARPNVYVAASLSRVWKMIQTHFQEFQDEDTQIEPESARVPNNRPRTPTQAGSAAS